jgi:hypothetical protein
LPTCHLAMLEETREVAAVITEAAEAAMAAFAK